MLTLSHVHTASPAPDTLPSALVSTECSTPPGCLLTVTQEGGRYLGQQLQSSSQRGPKVPDRLHLLHPPAQPRAHNSVSTMPAVTLRAQGSGS